LGSNTSHAPPAAPQIVSGGAAVNVGFWPVAKSVLLFLGVPLVAGVLLRIALVFTAGRRWFEGWPAAALLRPPPAAAGCLTAHPVSDAASFF
jgi:hypothetical protein